MLYRAMSLALVAVLLHGSVAAQAQPQSPPQTVAKMQQVLHKAQEKHKAVKIILNKKTDNQRKFSGKVNEITNGGFNLIDQKTGKTMTLAYEDVREVHQKGWPKSATIAIVVVAGVVIALVAIGYSID